MIPFPYLLSLFSGRGLPFPLVALDKTPNPSSEVKEKKQVLIGTFKLFTTVFLHL